MLRVTSLKDLKSNNFTVTSTVNITQDMILRGCNRWRYVFENQKITDAELPPYIVVQRAFVFVLVQEQSEIIK